MLTWIIAFILQKKKVKSFILLCSEREVLVPNSPHMLIYATLVSQIINAVPS